MVGFQLSNIHCGKLHLDLGAFKHAMPVPPARACAVPVHVAMATAYRLSEKGEVLLRGGRHTTIFVDPQ